MLKKIAKKIIDKIPEPPKRELVSQGEYHWVSVWEVPYDGVIVMHDMERRFKTRAAAAGMAEGAYNMQTGELWLWEEQTDAKK